MLVRASLVKVCGAPILQNVNGPAKGLTGFDGKIDAIVRSQSWVETLNNSKIINADYDVVAEAEAILADASLVSA